MFTFRAPLPTGGAATTTAFGGGIARAGTAGFLQSLISKTLATVIVSTEPTIIKAISVLFPFSTGVVTFPYGEFVIVYHGSAAGPEQVAGTNPARLRSTSKITCLWIIKVIPRIMFCLRERGGGKTLRLVINSKTVLTGANKCRHKIFERGPWDAKFSNIKIKHWE